MADFHQWSTVEEYTTSTSAPSWVLDPLDALRIRAYTAYEQIYRNFQDSFKLTQRGKDSKPIYIPTGKDIVETANRYTAKGLEIVPIDGLGTPADRVAAAVQWAAFAKRERFASKFASAKRYGLIRGDWAFQLYADPEKPPGSRLSIYTLDPSSLFPIYDPDQIDEIIGWHIAFQYDEGGEPKIHRTTYRKVTGTTGPSPISVEVGSFKMDAWGGPEMDPDQKPERVIRAEEILPDPITALPIYVIQNNQSSDSIWGNSEMQGVERLMAAINQSISDEELELVLNGLGVYVTDSGSPIDPNTREPVPWNLGPGRVLETPPGTDFKRVSGTTSVSPQQDHLKYLHSQVDQAVSQPAVAKGRVDVETAESGVALLLQMSPLLSYTEEKDLTIGDVLGNLAYDWGLWNQAYEEGEFKISPEVALGPIFGDKLPVNRAKRFEEIMSLVDAEIVSREWAHEELRKIGFPIPESKVMMAKVLEEKTALEQVAADVTGARVDADIEATTEEDDGQGTLDV